MGIFGIILSRSFVAAVLCAGVMGFSFAVTQWIPFTLLNIAILQSSGSTWETNSCGTNAGAVLGLHNTFVAGPQILSSVACAIVFKFVEKGVEDDTSSSMSWIFAGCGVISLVGAAMVLRLENDKIF